MKNLFKKKKPKYPVIIIDAGHGGLREDGKYASCPNYNPTNQNTWYKMYLHKGEPFYEGIFNRIIANKVINILSDKYNIHTTFDPISDIRLKERVKLANQYGSKQSILISIHANASPSHTASGIETYYYSDKGKELASFIQNDLVQSTATNKDRGVKYGNFYLLKRSAMVSALVECGFFDNYDESRLLLNKEYQNKIAKGMADGIIKYINTNKYNFS